MNFNDNNKEIYRKILESFEENYHKVNAQRTFQKKVFFWLVCVIFTIVVFVSLYFIWHTIKFNKFTTETLATLLTAFATIITSIIVLPNVIAKHLFPENGEDIGVEIIRAIQEYELRTNQNEDIDIDIKSED